MPTHLISNVYEEFQVSSQDVDLSLVNIDKPDVCINGMHSLVQSES